MCCIVSFESRQAKNKVVHFVFSYKKDTGFTRVRSSVNVVIWVDIDPQVLDQESDRAKIFFMVTVDGYLSIYNFIGHCIIIKNSCRLKNVLDKNSVVFGR
jgi:hypothetical protein